MWNRTKKKSDSTNLRNDISDQINNQKEQTAKQKQVCGF